MSRHSGLRCVNIDFKISYGNETRLNNDTESLKNFTLRPFKKVENSISNFKKMVLYR